MGQVHDFDQVDVRERGLKNLRVSQNQYFATAKFPMLPRWQRDQQQKLRLSPINNYKG